MLKHDLFNNLNNSFLDLMKEHNNTFMMKGDLYKHGILSKIFNKRFSLYNDDSLNFLRKRRVFYKSLVNLTYLNLSENFHRELSPFFFNNQNILKVFQGNKRKWKYNISRLSLGKYSNLYSLRNWGFSKKFFFLKKRSIKFIKYFFFLFENLFFFNRFLKIFNFSTINLFFNYPSIAIHQNQTYNISLLFSQFFLWHTELLKTKNICKTRTKFYLKDQNFLRTPDIVFEELIDKFSNDLNLGFFTRVSGLRKNFYKFFKMTSSLDYSKMKHRLFQFHEINYKIINQNNNNSIAYLKTSILKKAFFLIKKRISFLKSWLRMKKYRIFFLKQFYTRIRSKKIKKLKKKKMENSIGFLNFMDFSGDNKTKPSIYAFIESYRKFYRKFINKKGKKVKKCKRIKRIKKRRRVKWMKFSFSRRIRKLFNFNYKKKRIDLHSKFIILDFLKKVLKIKDRKKRKLVLNLNTKKSIKTNKRAKFNYKRRFYYKKRFYYKRKIFDKYNYRKIFKHKTKFGFEYDLFENNFLNENYPLFRGPLYMNCKRRTVDLFFFRRIRKLLLIKKLRLKLRRKFKRKFSFNKKFNKSKYFLSRKNREEEFKHTFPFKYENVTKMPFQVDRSIIKYWSFSKAPFLYKLKLFEFNWETKYLKKYYLRKRVLRYNSIKPSRRFKRMKSKKLQNFFFKSLFIVFYKSLYLYFFMFLKKNFILLKKNELCSFLFFVLLFKKLFYKHLMLLSQYVYISKLFYFTLFIKKNFTLFRSDNKTNVKFIHENKFTLLKRIRLLILYYLLSNKFKLKYFFKYNLIRRAFYNQYYSKFFYKKKFFHNKKKYYKRKLFYLFYRRKYYRWKYYKKKFFYNKKYYKNKLFYNKRYYKKKLIYNKKYYKKKFFYNKKYYKKKPVYNKKYFKKKKFYRKRNIKRVKWNRSKKAKKKNNIIIMVRLLKKKKRSIRKLIVSLKGKTIRKKKRFEKKFIRLKKKILLYRQKCGEIIGKKTKFLSKNIDFNQIECYFNNVNSCKESKIFNFWASKWKSIEIFSKKRPFSFFSQKKFSFKDNQFLYYYYYLASFKSNIHIFNNIYFSFLYLFVKSTFSRFYFKVKYLLSKQINNLFYKYNSFILYFGFFSVIMSMMFMFKASALRGQFYQESSGYINSAIFRNMLSYLFYIKEKVMMDSTYFVINKEYFKISNINDGLSVAKSKLLFFVKNRFEDNDLNLQEDPRIKYSILFKSKQSKRLSEHYTKNSNTHDNIIMHPFINKRLALNFSRKILYVFLTSTYNNVFMSILGRNGNLLAKSSNGMLGFKGPKRRTELASKFNSFHLFKKLFKRFSLKPEIMTESDFNHNMLFKTNDNFHKSKGNLEKVKKVKESFLNFVYFNYRRIYPKYSINNTINTKYNITNKFNIFLFLNANPIRRIIKGAVKGIQNLSRWENELKILRFISICKMPFNGCKKKKIRRL